jgi:hypothetical protein
MLCAVPTDPFVSPDPDDRPRQQQNLPPGVAYPPARHWVPSRPGDRPTGGPVGPLRGAPGPNIGYAYTLANRVKDRFRLGPHEHVEDAVAVVAEIAARRAANFRRAPVIHDVEWASTLLGYDENGEWAKTRALLVHEASHSYVRRRALVDSVPDDLLRAGPNEIRARTAEWRSSVPRVVAAYVAP